MRASLALLLALTLAAACTSEAGPSERSAAEPPTGCGPVPRADVRGPAPAHAKRALDRFPNDHAVCAALWLRTGDGFVPQGVAVADGTAWVSGFDGDAQIGSRYCALRRVDLRSGRELARVDALGGQVGTRPPVMCRHGGGLVRDGHGLWLVETSRLWLLDPESLTVRRGWWLEPPLRGSFAVHDDEGRLGVGGWSARRASRLFWFDPDALVASAALDLTADLALDSRRVPRATQGAVWGGFGHGPARVWFARSVTRCGILAGPVGQRGFVPGAEGMAAAERGQVWVLSESGTRYYQRQGGRPLVPTLLRVDLRDVAQWSRPTCSV